MKHDILTANEELLSVEMVDGKINSYKNKNITKKGIRLFENNKIYSTSYVGEITDADLLKKAEISKTVGVPFEYELPKDSKLTIIDEESLKAPLTAINEAIELSQEYISKLQDKFIFNGKFDRSIITRRLVSSEGVALEQKFAYNDWYYIFKRVGSPQLMDGYVEENGSNLNVKDVFEKNIPFLNAYRNEITFKEGKYPVLFVESGTLLHKLSESLMAEKYCEGSAIYSGKLNTQILSTNFSLYDISYSPAHGLYRKFDDEGTKRILTQLPLIENGVFKNIIAGPSNCKKIWSGSNWEWSKKS